MKLLPSVAFNDFSGSAGNVTARKTGDRTILSTRSKHSKKKTTYQASTRCRFADTTRGYSKITEEQRQGWISLAKNLGTYQTSTGKTSITGHNLFVAINSYRKICGKPQTAIAPPELKASDYIRFDDFWLSPEHIVFTGLGERANVNEVLYVEMYPAQSPAENRCWDKTVLVAVIPATDWGEIDLTSAFLEKFGAPLKIGQKVFIKLCWLDSECGYIRNYTLIAHNAQITSLERNIPFRPRALLKLDNLDLKDSNVHFDKFDIELSPGSKITSDEITFSQSANDIAGFGFETSNIMNEFQNTFSYQYARDQSTYRIILTEVQINRNNTTLNFFSRTLTLTQNMEIFGTYFLNN